MELKYQVNSGHMSLKHNLYCYEIFLKIFAHSSSYVLTSLMNYTSKMCNNVDLYLLWWPLVTNNVNGSYHFILNLLRLYFISWHHLTVNLYNIPFSLLR